MQKVWSKCWSALKIHVCQMVAKSKTCKSPVFTCCLQKTARSFSGSSGSTGKSWDNIWIPFQVTYFQHPGLEYSGSFPQSHPSFIYLLAQKPSTTPLSVHRLAHKIYHIKVRTGNTIQQHVLAYTVSWFPKWLREEHRITTRTTRWTHCFLNSYNTPAIRLVNIR